MGASFLNLVAKKTLTDKQAVSCCCVVGEMIGCWLAFDPCIGTHEGKKGANHHIPEFKDGFVE